MSIGISTSTMSGWRKLSNCAHRMKYMSRMDTNRITVSSPIIFSFEKKLPAKSTSQPSVSCITSSMSSISFGAFGTS